VTDRTEKPTPRKITEAREEGQVVRSLEVNTAAILLLSVILLRGPGKSLVSALSSLVVDTIGEMNHVELTAKWLQNKLIDMLIAILPSLGAIVLGLLLVGVVVTLSQTGFMWTSKRIGFDFKRLNPLNGLKRIFSKNGIFELFKTLGKLVIIGWVTYAYLKANYQQLIVLTRLDFAQAVNQIVQIFFTLMLRVSLVYFILAAADYMYQRWEYMRNLRMTKQEIKEEFKRSEGDPLLKSRIRAQQRRFARKRMMANVPKATVIITNPTHIALAIQYSNDMNAPKVLAKGAYQIAERIVSIAKSHSIPVVQNIPLAWAIYRTVEIDQEISPDLYKAVAEVLAFVYRSKQPRPLLNRPARVHGIPQG
jgi:flagellar biosynthetic protein FlhB